MRLFTAFLNILGFLEEHPVFKGILYFQFTPEKSLSVIYRRVIAQRIAGTVFIVEIHVLHKNFLELFPYRRKILFKFFSLY